MTRLADTLEPISRAALASLARDLDHSRQSELHTHRAPSYIAAPVRGGATRSDQVDEIYARAAFDRVEMRRGPRRYAWQRRIDCVGRRYYTCRVMWHGKYDLNASTRVTADTLRDLWDTLADRELIGRDAWADDGMFLAFLMLGNVTPRPADIGQRADLNTPMSRTAYGMVGGFGYVPPPAGCGTLTQ